MLAPVMITTYSRKDHLSKTIEALKSNKLADKTDVYVYVDGPKIGDEKKVAGVLDYLSQVEGFNKFEVITRPENLGPHENAKQANFEIAGKFGRLIRLEDDIVTATGFLTFMNDALDAYQRHPRVLSVSAYCPPIKFPENYSKDVWFIRRFNGWGCGIWHDRLQHVYKEITPTEIELFLRNKAMVSQFVAEGGRDMLDMLKMVVKGRLEAADVNSMFVQFVREQYTVYPSQSLVKNIGLDGSGVHCGITNRFDTELSDKTEFSFPSDVRSDPELLIAHRKFRDRGRLQARFKTIVHRFLALGRLNARYLQATGR